ncbi:MAG TPA: hypothetical protein ENN64_01020 [bacterium]|nr:hypothetical protein [bacterium]
MNILGIIFIIFSILAIVIYSVRNKLVDILILTLAVGYFISIGLGIIGIFFPNIPESLADLTLQKAGVYEQIREIDQSSPQNLLDEAKDMFNNLFGVFNDTDENFSDIDETEDDKGFLEKTFYASLVAILAIIYRYIAIIASFLGQILIIYLSYAASGVIDARKAERRLDELNSRVRYLETVIRESSLPQNEVGEPLN